MNCDHLRTQILRTVETAFSCSLERDMIRVALPLWHPDRDQIAVYVYDEGDAIVLSDYGQTFDRLDNAGVDISPERKSSIEDMLSDLGASIRGWEIRHVVPLGTEIGAALLAFGQAISNVSALAYKKVQQEPSVFQQAVRSLLTARGIRVFDPYTVRLQGERLGKRFYRKIRFPMAMFDRAAPVLLISAEAVNTENAQVNRVFRAWYDFIRLHGEAPARVTLVNDTHHEPNPANLEVLDSVSRTLTYREVETLPRQTLEQKVFVN